MWRAITATTLPQYLSWKSYRNVLQLRRATNAVKRNKNVEFSFSKGSSLARFPKLPRKYISTKAKKHIPKKFHIPQKSMVKILDTDMFIIWLFHECKPMQVLTNKRTIAQWKKSMVTSWLVSKCTCLITTTCQISQNCHGTITSRNAALQQTIVMCSIYFVLGT